MLGEAKRTENPGFGTITHENSFFVIATSFTWTNRCLFRQKGFHLAIFLIPIQPFRSFQMSDFTKVHKQVLLFLMAFLGFSSVIAQNLAPNPSFEVYTYCPVGPGSGALPATPWRAASNGSPDYFNTCAVFS